MRTGTTRDGIRLSTVVNLHRYFEEIWNEASPHEQMDLHDLRLPKASAVQ